MTEQQSELRVGVLRWMFALIAALIAFDPPSAREAEVAIWVLCTIGIWAPVGR